MVKLLIHTKDAPRHPNDDAVNAGMFQPGDVVLILEDDEQFAPGDVGTWNTPVEIAGVKRADLDFLTAPEVKVNVRMDPETLEMISETKLLQLRQWNSKDNLDALKMVSGTAQVTKGEEVTFAKTYFKQTLKDAEAPVPLDELIKEAVRG